MATREEEYQIMMQFVSAPSMDAARAVVRQHPILKDPGAVGLLERMMTSAHQAGQLTAFERLSAARQRLAQIQSGR